MRDWHRGTLCVCRDAGEDHRHRMLTRVATLDVRRCVRQVPSMSVGATVPRDMVFVRGRAVVVVGVVVVRVRMHVLP